MESTITNLTHFAQRKAAEKIIDVTLNKIHRDREEGLLKIVDFAKPFIGEGISEEQFEKTRAMIRDPENRWMKVANRILDLVQLCRGCGAVCIHPLLQCQYP